MDRLLMLLTLLAATLLSGCASAPPVLGPAVETLLHDAQFSPPTEPPDAAQVLAFTPEMADYLRNRVAPALRRSGPQRGLLEALYSRQQLKLEYDAERTRTAAEAFQSRAGNCLSLAIMTAAFAKEVGIGVRFQSVEVESTWSRSGDLVLHNSHVNVSLGQMHQQSRVTYGAEWITIDFIPEPESARARINVIDERRVVAMFMNNRAAETLAKGDSDDAYWWARAAVMQDPEYAEAYNTLAVVYRRRGQLAWAEPALRRTLALDGNNINALGNLAAVLDQSGRLAEAQVLAGRLKQLQPVPPFELYEEGMQALRRGDFRRARDLLEKELPRSNENHEVHLALALAYLQLGDGATAARHLELARENAATRQQRAVYAAKLEHLKAQGMH